MGDLEEYWKYKFRRYWQWLLYLCLFFVMGTLAFFYHLQHHDAFVVVDMIAIGCILPLMDKVCRKIKNLNNKRPPGV